MKIPGENKRNKAKSAYKRNPHEIICNKAKLGENKQRKLRKKAPTHICIISRFLGN